MAIKKNDFIEIDYTGRVDGLVFDTTIESVAKDAGIYEEGRHFHPMTVCVGRGHLLHGLDLALEGKEIGSKHEVSISPEDGFGRKRTDLVQLIPTARFRKEKIMVEPGLRIQVDGTSGTVKTVSGGRTLVDFNHPLAGKELRYEYTIHRTVTDGAEKVKALLHTELGVHADVQVTENNAVITLPTALPGEIGAKIAESIKKAVPELKDVNFKASA